MMESVHPRSGRPEPSNSGSFATRRTRSSSITSLTNPTTPYQEPDHGRLGTGFSILKPEVPKNQPPQAPLHKILALPPWLQDTIAKLDASHPLRAVFPVLHDASDHSVADNPLENSSDHPIPQRAHPGNANWSFRFPSTLQTQSRTCQPGSDASSDELQLFSTHYPVYHNSLLYLRPGSPTPFTSVLSRPEGTFPTVADSCPSPSAPINVANPAHISGFETTPLSASSLNRGPPDQGPLATRRGVESDGIFRYSPPQTNSTAVLPPFAFGRPIQVYFDSPIEDPVSTDPLEPGDYDPFKLDPEEYKNLGFKWAPCDRHTRAKRLSTREPEASALACATDEVNSYCD
ncbi:hypothetical protein BDM02DRAFT_3190431 [Thelephora ganbajun]|uniref:Uncharacterized protein n=1 Tax=Thelephora ganbajun TaxID=370292 RepID=A0ACB6Z4E2_THEGA|nr:hypothetical protein BDM02DRAFT_3190431 [Thelephora ganbajun]